MPNLRESSLVLFTEDIGLNKFVPSVLLDLSQMRIADNIMYWGGRRSRGGSLKINSSAMDDGGGADTVRSIFEFVKGSTVNCIIFGGTRIHTLNLATGAITNKTAALTLAEDSLLDGVGFNGNFLATDGTNDMITWDGGAGNFTVLADTTATGVKYLTVHDTRVFGIGIAADPHRLYWSASYDETDWTTANNAGSILVYPEQGGKVTGICSYKGYLYVFKERAIFIVDTSPTSLSTWKIYKIVEGLGCLSHRTIQQIGKDLIFVSKRGVVSFNQVGDYTINALTEPIINDWIGFDKAIVDKWDSAVDRTRGWYVISYNENSGSEPDKMLVFDPERRVIEGVWSGISCTSLVSTENATFDELYLAGGSDGFVRKFNDLSLDSDDSSSYVCQFETPWVPLLVDENNKILEFTLVELGLFYTPVSSTCDVLVSVYIDGKSPYATYTFTLQITGTTLGTFILGIDELGAAGSLLSKTSIGGQGQYVKLKFKSNAADEVFNIYGFYIQYLRSGEM